MRSVAMLCRMAVVACVGMVPALAAQAQDYPNRPVKLIVPFTPGGSTDVMARLLAPVLGQRLGQTIVVENKPGAGTVLGADLVARSPADGYTLLLSAASTYTVNPVVYASLPYDHEKAFQPLGIVASTPLVLLANPGRIKANTLKELAAEAAGHADLAYGSFGSGSTSHFAGEMLNTALGIQPVHVPYRGSAPAMTDLIGGQVPLTVDTVVAAAPQVSAGKVKALAVTSAQRSQMLPDVPTATESGYPSVQFSTWFAFVAPSGLPAPVSAKLEQAIAGMMADKAVQDSLLANGYEPEYGTPAQYRERVAEELPRLRRIAQDAKIQAN
ncbi:Tricarboxylate transport protein TctC [plant metagenome]|uniref:Tricarboxylate transport protein TctC n=1 Tax=plant metagenome TaxID=1297885 RepID=A0A484RCB8_9ZZZZ